MSEQIANTVMIPADQLRPIADELRKLQAKIERLRAENAELKAFCRDISEQIPEQPDYWSSCSQCAKNIYTAEDMLEALKPDSEAG